METGSIFVGHAIAIVALKRAICLLPHRLTLYGILIFLCLKIVASYLDGHIGYKSTFDYDKQFGNYAHSSAVSFTDHKSYFLND